jgi:glycerophosphoryl diester phosphodiesterase
MPPPRFRFLDHPGPIPFAHRGGAKESPENTWAAFSHARTLGYRYIETDVHVTTDGVVAIIHDPVLDRVADRPGSVAALPWAEVAAARIGGKERVPRLDEVIAAWPDARWNIDAKHDAVVEPLIDVLRRGGALERVCVTSFSDERIGRLRALGGPGLCTSTGRRATTALRLASYIPGPTALVARRREVRWAGAGCTQVPGRWGRVPVADRRYVAFAHRQQIDVHVWTVDDEAAMDHFIELGVDGIMTDRPSVLKTVLERRGLWSGLA